MQTSETERKANQKISHSLTQKEVRETDIQRQTKNRKTISTEISEMNKNNE